MAPGGPARSGGHAEMKRGAESAARRIEGAGCVENEIEVRPAKQAQSVRDVAMPGRNGSGAHPAGRTRSFQQARW